MVKCDPRLEKASVDTFPYLICNNITVDTQKQPKQAPFIDAYDALKKTFGTLRVD